MFYSRFFPIRQRKDKQISDDVDIFILHSIEEYMYLKIYSMQFCEGVLL